MCSLQTVSRPQKNSWSVTPLMWNSIERCLKDFQIIFHHKRDLGGGLELRGETDGYWRAESGQTVSLTLHGLSLLKLELSHQHHIAVH